MLPTRNARGEFVFHDLSRRLIVLVATASKATLPLGVATVKQLPKPQIVA